jgi:integrase
MIRPRGTGTIEPLPWGGFRVRIPIAGKREDFGPFATREEAEEMAKALRLTAHREGVIVSGVKTLASYGPEVHDEREKAGYATVDDHRGIWRREVLTWSCSKWPLAAVGAGDVRRWVSALSAKHKTSTVKNCLSALRAVFSAAAQDGLVEVNPCEGVEIRGRGETEETSTFLSRLELEGLIEAAGAPDGLLVAFAAGTGLRQGEMRGLLVSDVHLDCPAPWMTVRFGAPGKPTKPRRIRKAPIFGLALEAAREWVKVRPKSDRGLMFPRPSGEPRAKGAMVSDDAWDAWLRTAGIRRNVRWHDLRHTCATLLLQGAWGQPWSLEEVKEMLGHSSLRVTERYAKATGSLADRAAAEKFGPVRSWLPSLAIASAGELSRRGSDSNRRMTVLQSGHVSNSHVHLDPNTVSRGTLEATETATHAYLRAVVAGDRHAHTKGLELVARVHSLVDEVRAALALPEREPQAVGGAA